MDDVVGRPGLEPGTNGLKATALPIELPTQIKPSNSIDQYCVRQHSTDDIEVNVLLKFRLFFILSKI